MLAKPPEATLTTAPPRRTATIVHVLARIRAGRSVETPKSLRPSMPEVAKQAKSAAPPSTPVALSVELQENDPEMLFRRIALK